MRYPGALVLSVLICLAAACSGGGPSPAGGSGTQPEASTGIDTETEQDDEAASDVLALPGLPDYVIPVNTARGALALADEPREVPWASDTEATIIAEISAVIDDTMTLVDVECRTTWCGLVVEFPQGTDVNVAGIVGDRLQELFDVTGLPRVTIYRLDGSGWTAVYIEIRRMV